MLQYSQSLCGRGLNLEVWNRTLKFWNCLWKGVSFFHTSQFRLLSIFKENPANIIGIHSILMFPDFFSRPGFFFPHSNWIPSFPWVYINKMFSSLPKITISLNFVLLPSVALKEFSPVSLINYFLLTSVPEWIFNQFLWRGGGVLTSFSLHEECMYHKIKCSVELIFHLQLVVEKQSFSSIKRKKS